MELSTLSVSQPADEAVRWINALTQPSYIVIIIVLEKTKRKKKIYKK
jgi:hypothetical protein